MKNEKIKIKKRNEPAPRHFPFFIFYSELSRRNVRSCDRWLLVCVLSSAMIWNSWASPTTITLHPVADAEIQAADPDHNFGSQLDMVSGALGPRAGQVVRRGLLRFDLAGRIPSGAIINSTTLQVRVVKVPSGPASSIFDLWRILQPWSEGGVTWNSRLPNTLWEEPGVTGAGDSVAQASSTTFVAGVKEGTELPLDVEEGDEMGDRQFASILAVLKGAFLPRGHDEKFNPFHSIALAKALIFLRGKIAGDGNFRSFHNMLAHLEMNGIRLNSYASEVHDAMSRREI